MKRVLIVEDEYFLAADCVLELDRLGIVTVGPANTTPRALALIERGPVDGAIINVSLQGERSYVVADSLASRGIPFIFYTGYDPGILPSRFAHVACVCKPQSAETVVRTLLADMEVTPAHRSSDC
jgi:CheY-like chemotaxis protein